MQHDLYHQEKDTIKTVRPYQLIKK